MYNKKITQDMIDDLYKLITSVKNTDECKLLFEDLCTYKEIEQMAQRARAALLLMENKTYAQIIEQTDISSATLSRVSRCVHEGRGYNTMLKKEDVNLNIDKE